MQRTFLSQIALWLLMMLFSVSAFAQIAAVPNSMNFQGRLTKPDGTPVANGTYNLQFSLYNALTGGTLWWQRNVTNIPVREGTFAARLDFSSGFQNGATLASVFGASAVYLEIQIGTNAPLSPRQQLMTVAYAMKADSVKDNAITSASVSNGSLTNADFAPGTLNPLAWLLNGNSNTNGTQFLGTTDNQPLIFKVNNQHALSMQYMLNGDYEGNNLIGGYWLNSTVSFGVSGVTILGGLKLSGVDYPNAVTDHGGTVSGGAANRAGNNNSNFTDARFATVGGGTGNFASGINSTVSGGTGNSSTGHAATVPGGAGNFASGEYSFAAGINARAIHNGAFVWSDSTTGGIGSTAPNQFILRASGGVGINTAVPNARLHVNSGTSAVGIFVGNLSGFGFAGLQTNFNAATTHIWCGENNNRVFSVTGGGVVHAASYHNLSDRRYKTHINTLPNALDTILNLRGVTFDWNREQWKDRGFAEGRQIGFIAQEVEKVLPKLVTTDEKGYKSVAYANIVPVLVEAVKTQQKQIESRDNRLSDQQKEIDALKAQLAELAAVVRELQAKNR